MVNTDMIWVDDVFEPMPDEEKSRRVNETWMYAKMSEAMKKGNKMSQVTNVILIIDGWEQTEDEYNAAMKFDSILMEDTKWELGELGTDNAGGPKYLDVDIYAAALNYFHPEDVLAAFRKVKWACDSSAVLVINDHEGVTKAYRGVDVRRDDYVDTQD